MLGLGKRKERVRLPDGWEDMVDTVRDLKKRLETQHDDVQQLGRRFERLQGSMSRLAREVMDELYGDEESLDEEADGMYDMLNKRRKANDG